MAGSPGSMARPRWARCSISRPTPGSASGRRPPRIAPVTCHVIGAGVVVQPHLARDRVILAPGDNGIEDAIAARGLELVFRPAQTHQVPAVVLQVEIGLHVAIAGASRGLAV